MSTVKSDYLLEQLEQTKHLLESIKIYSKTDVPGEYIVAVPDYFNLGNTSWSSCKDSKLQLLNKIEELKNCGKVFFIFKDGKSLSPPDIEITLNELLEAGKSLSQANEILIKKKSIDESYL